MAKPLLYPGLLIVFLFVVSLGAASLVSAQPQAQVVSLSKIADTPEGNSVYLWAYVKNTGDAYLADNCFVRFYVTGPATNGYVGYRPCTANDYGGNTGALIPGEQRWYKISWLPPQAGAYNYYAVVDYAGGLISPWPTGQGFKITPKIISAQVTSMFKVPDSPEGNRVILWTKVKNTGNTNLSDGCFVRIYVRGPQTNNYVGYKGCAVNELGGMAKPLAPGEERWYEATWTAPQAGTYTYYASVDYQNIPISNWSAGQVFRVKAKTTTTTTTTTTKPRITTTTTTTTKPTQTTLKPVVKWDAAASFKTAKWKAYTPQIWGNDAVDGATYYTKLEGAGDDTYTTYNRYCPFDGRNNEYPDTWHIERKYVSNGKYKILVRGKSTSDCKVGQPVNTGYVKLNPESGWKITQVDKCTVSQDTQSSNGIYIPTWCMADAVNGIISWQSGSTCAGCCVCGDGAAVDIDITVEKQ